MASLSEIRTIGAVIILLEGLIGSSQDAELVDQIEPTYEALREYLNEKDKARLDKLSKMDAAKKDTEFDRAGYNNALIASIREMTEVGVNAAAGQTAAGKSVTKISFEVDGKEVFLYDFKAWQANETRAYWVKGAELARVLYVNKSGYLALDTKRGKAVILAGTDRVTPEMDIPF